MRRTGRDKIDHYTREMYVLIKFRELRNFMSIETRSTEWSISLDRSDTRDRPGLKRTKISDLRELPNLSIWSREARRGVTRRSTRPTTKTRTIWIVFVVGRDAHVELIGRGIRDFPRVNLPARPVGKSRESERGRSREKCANATKIKLDDYRRFGGNHQASISGLFALGRIIIISRWDVKIIFFF